MIVSAGQPGKDNQGRTARTGLSRKDSGHDRSGKNNQDKTARAGAPGKDSQNFTVRK